MSDKYQITDESMQEVFGDQRKYRVPLYQRDYSWDKEKMERLWDDTITNNDDTEYLLGALVVINTQQGHFDVVDGQQRLATLTLMLCAIRDYIYEHTKDASPSKNTILNTITKCISHENEVRLFLSVSDRVCLEKIQKNTNGIKNIRDIKKEIKSDKKFSKSQKWLLGNYAECCRKINTFCEENKIDLENNSGEAIEKLREKLAAILTKNRFAFIKVEDESYAFKIFEALNTTGQKLTQADMVKNYIIHKTKQEDRTHIQQRWEKIMKFDKPDYFLYESLLSRNPNDKRIQIKRLYDIIKEQLQTKNIDDYLGELDEDSKCFSYMENPSQGKTNQEYESKTDLIFTGFNDLGTRYISPVVLAASRRWDFRCDDFNTLCQCLLVFFFRFRTIKDGSTDTVRNIARKITTEILNGKSLNDILKTILIDEKGKQYTQDDEFEKKFTEYAEEISSANVAKYILRSIEEWYRKSDDLSLEYDSYELEHILPQKSKKWNANEFHNESSENIEDFKKRLGNLTLILQPWNGQ